MTTEQTTQPEKKQYKSKFVKFVEPPVDYKRQTPTQLIVDVVKPLVVGNNFLEPFLSDIAEKEKRFGSLTPKQEAWLTKIEVTFFKEIHGKEFVNPMDSIPF